MDINPTASIFYLALTCVALIIAIVFYLGYKAIRRRQAGAQNDEDHSEREARERESRQWQQTLRDFENKFSEIGSSDLWETMEGDFAAWTKDVIGHTPNDQLFTVQERELRVASRLEELEADFKERMQKRVNSERWFKYSRPLSMEELEHTMVNDGKAIQWNKEYKLYLKKAQTIREASFDELFSERDRGPRILPIVRSLRRNFKKNAEEKIRLHSQFNKLWQNLPADPLDDELDVLRLDFKELGRQRTWFRGFDDFVNKVLVMPKDSNQPGANEPSVRILQSDFLAEMEERFWLYCHYQQLRNQHGELFADRISFFESGLAALRRRGASDRDIDEYLRNAIAIIENEVSRHRAITEQRTVTRRVDIDHRQRLPEWTAFKDRRHQLAVNAQFNALIPILLKNPEWANEAKQFKSAIKEKRIRIPGREKSRAEAREVGRFIKGMSARVEAELATDVAYRTLEQELTSHGEYQDELVEFQQELAREIRLQRPPKERRTDELKREFIKRIRHKREPDSHAPTTVTPLLPGRTAHHKSS